MNFDIYLIKIKGNLKKFASRMFYIYRCEDATGPVRETILKMDWNERQVAKTGFQQAQLI